jgi:anti-anti-sigma regulatory factor
MAFEIRDDGMEVTLELAGAVTIRQAADLAHQMGAVLAGGGRTVRIDCRAVEDVDAAILQLLVSVSRSAASCELAEPSEAFLDRAGRCAMRLELGLPSRVAA